jgi:hypothetical protein
MPCLLVPHQHEREEPDAFACGLSSMAIPRYLIFNGIMGAAVGALFGTALLITDTLGMRALVLASPNVIATTAIFLIGSAMTFAPFVVATAVMLLDQRLR